MVIRVPRLLVLLFALTCAAILGPSAVRAQTAAAEAAWKALQAGGAVALMRHATAPGTGDPPGFRLDDCSTQRILSADGRAEAQRIGAAIRARGVAVDAVYASQWCRCLETAELLGLGAVTPFPALNSFFQNRGAEPAQTGAVRALLVEQPFAGALILVTHQVNITALTGIVPRSGEMVVVMPGTGGALEIVGRIPPP